MSSKSLRKKKKWCVSTCNLFLSLSLLSFTVKILKIQTPKKFAVIALKFEQGCFTVRLMHPKDAEVIANSVDPESDLGLHCLPRPVCPKT